MSLWVSDYLCQPVYRRGEGHLDPLVDVVTLLQTEVDRGDVC